MSTTQHTIQVAAAGLTFEFGLEAPQTDDLRLEYAVEPFGRDGETFLIRFAAARADGAPFAAAG